MDSSLIQVILTNAGVGIAVSFILVVTGVLVPGYAYRRLQGELDKRDSLADRLRETLESERQQANEAVRTANQAASAAGTTNQLIEALVGFAQDVRNDREDQARNPRQRHRGRAGGHEIHERREPPELDEFSASTLGEEPGGGHT